MNLKVGDIVMDDDRDYGLIITNRLGAHKILWLTYMSATEKALANVDVNLEVQHIIDEFGVNLKVLGNIYNVLLKED